MGMGRPECPGVASPVSSRPFLQQRDLPTGAAGMGTDARGPLQSVRTRVRTDINPTEPAGRNGTGVFKA